MVSVFVSILNWNDAASTLKCVEAVRLCIVPKDVDITLVILDNGSEPADWTALQLGLTNSYVLLLRQEKNIGFAGGHNIVIRQAIDCKADFIWLLNNDALVRFDTLAGLLQVLSDDPYCGIVSPLIYALHDEKIVDFVGAIHDWKKLDSERPNEPTIAKNLQEKKPSDFFVFGTAPLLKIPALVATGLLNEELFAYYEDNDICVRLSKQGWFSKMAYSITIQHFRRQAVSKERPAYFFYLMARNSLFFYTSFTPKDYRRLIRTRLFSRAMITAAKLRAAGMPDKSNACLLGIWDGLCGRKGQPRLNGKPPLWLIFISNVFPYRLHQFLDKS